jgi:3-(3-hydroxy-phenyl)propionate hydroxylase
VIRNTGEASLKQAASACSKLRHLPVQVVLVGREPLANDAPPYAYQDVDGVLIDWMDRQNCDVVIARPDHYVYGACEKVQDVDALLQTFASALQNSQADCRTPVASA